MAARASRATVDDGLTRFKSGWATGTRTAYLCGRIMDRHQYEPAQFQFGTVQGRLLPRVPKRCNPVTMSPLRCAVVASTAGSVLGVLLDDPEVRSHIAAVIVDRECGALRRRLSTASRRQPSSNRTTCASALDCSRTCKNTASTIVISFFTRMFEGELLEVYLDRIVNTAPVDPALVQGTSRFRGCSGVRDSVCGFHNSLHRRAMDEGKIILQSAIAVDPAESPEVLRHRLFVQQCKGLRQVIAWLAAERITVSNGRVIIADARYDSLEFVPALDDPGLRFSWISPFLRGCAPSEARRWRLERPCRTSPVA